MKYPLLALTLTISFFHLSVAMASQSSDSPPSVQTVQDSIFSKEGKFGVTDALGKEKLPFQFDELYALTKTVEFWDEANGFLGLREGKWSYYDNAYKLVKKGLDFDNWIGNSGIRFPLVRSGNQVMFFDTDSLVSIAMMAYEGDDNDHYRNLGVLQSQATKRWGGIDYYGNILHDFTCEQLYSVNKNFYAFGYVARENGQWNFYDSRFTLMKTELPFDQWLTNSGLVHGFVLKDGNVHLFSPETYEVTPMDFSLEALKITNRLQKRSTHLIVLQDEKTKAYGAINANGIVVLPFQYDEIFTNSSNDSTPLLAKNGMIGDIYSGTGELLISDNRSPSNVGFDGVYYQLQEGTDRFAPRALFRLDMERKELMQVTEFKVWWFNVPYGKSEYVATATYKDNTNVHITKDGQEVEITR